LRGGKKAYPDNLEEKKRSNQRVSQYSREMTHAPEPLGGKVGMVKEI